MTGITGHNYRRHRIKDPTRLGRWRGIKTLADSEGSVLHGGPKMYHRRPQQGAQGHILPRGPDFPATPLPLRMPIFVNYK